MVKRFAAVLLSLMLFMTGGAFAEIQWQQETEGQKMLKEYIEAVNLLLAETGEKPINRLFEMYRGFAVLGITEEEDAEIPEGVEITVQLYPEAMNTLELRADNADRFPRIAACLIRALYGESMTAEEAITAPREKAERAKTTPANSFEEPIEEMNGTIPRVYYAYFPNQYHDGVNWLQMTLVFPMAGTWDGTGLITGEEKTAKSGLLPEDEGDPDYEGYFSEDDYNHLEVFATATPEPDSAAAEYDFR